MDADAHRSTLGDDIKYAGSFADNEWSADGSTLAFVSTTRDHKQATLRIANATTGEVRTVHSEKVATQYESGQTGISWRYLPKRNAFIWYSEQSDWGHLYLYDLSTGKLLNRITEGNFVVSQIWHIDEEKGMVYFEAKGKEAGRNPYFGHLYKVGLDGKGLTLLTPENANHLISLSPDGRFFVDNYSQPDVPAVSVLRNTDGKLISTLETADISKLKAAGWIAPQPITVKSADGRWDLYGLMFAPPNREPGKKYPVINYVYPGPQGGSMGSRTAGWSFSTSNRDNQALAALGFVVVVIEGTCNPNRSKSFHDACYGSLAINTLPDQIAGIRQLAVQHNFIDLDRVGIWGHSGGGSATTAAMFNHADFYKVGIAESGNHDNRNYEDDWAERYIGLEQKLTDSRTNYDEDAVSQHAGKLKGKLLLAHGGMDDNVPPYHTYLVVDALVKANKDFDLLIFPNARHGFGESSNYMMRRRWDYFIQHLMGGTPPGGYKMGNLTP
jgi:dipeptidyl aminopeptidase/acylaminoacyl peptidase